MPNLMITASCNLGCSYCFASEIMSGRPKNSTMDWQTFVDILDWIDRGQTQGMSIHLMGGEPTLSPLLTEMITEISRRSRDIYIFSNGTVKLSDELVLLSKKHGVKWVFNVNEPKEYIGKQLNFLQYNMELLGLNCSLNINIYSADVNPDYVFDYFKQYDLTSLLKVGIALPTYGKNNAYISDKLFEQVQAILRQILLKAQENNIHVATECGVPVCLFDGFLEEFPGVIKDDVIGHCGSRLDITPEGDLINCLPLSGVHQVNYKEFDDYIEASLWFQKILVPYRHFSGMSDQCLDCQLLMDGTCKVCFAHSLSSFSKIHIPPYKSRPKEL